MTLITMAYVDGSVELPKAETKKMEVVKIELKLEARSLPCRRSKAGDQ